MSKNPRTDTRCRATRLPLLLLVALSLLLALLCGVASATTVTSGDVVLRAFDRDRCRTGPFCPTGLVRLDAGDGMYLVPETIRTHVSQNDDGFGTVRRISLVRDTNGDILAATTTFSTCQNDNTPTAAAPLHCGRERTMTVSLSAVACPTFTDYDPSSPDAIDGCRCVAGYRAVLLQTGDNSGTSAAFHCERSHPAENATHRLTHDASIFVNNNTDCTQPKCVTLAMRIASTEGRSILENSVSLVVQGTVRLEQGGAVGDIAFARDNLDRIVGASAHVTVCQLPRTPSDYCGDSGVAHVSLVADQCPDESTWIKGNDYSAKQCTCTHGYVPTYAPDGCLQRCAKVEVPDAPTHVRIVAADPGHIAFEWKRPVVAAGNVTAYSVAMQLVRVSGQGAPSTAPVGPGTSLTRHWTVDQVSTSGDVVRATVNDNAVAGGIYSTVVGAWTDAGPTYTSPFLVAINAPCAPGLVPGPGNLTGAYCIPCPQGTYANRLTGVCENCTSGDPGACASPSSRENQPGMRDWAETLTSLQTIGGASQLEPGSTSSYAGEPLNKYEVAAITAGAALTVCVLGLPLLCCRCGRKCLRKIDRDQGEVASRHTHVTFGVEGPHAIVSMHADDSDTKGDYTHLPLPGSMLGRSKRDINFVYLYLNFCAFVCLFAALAYVFYDFEAHRFLALTLTMPASTPAAASIPGGLSMTDDPPIPGIEVLLPGFTMDPHQCRATLSVSTGAGVGEKATTATFNASIEWLNDEWERRLMIPLSDSPDAGALLSPSERALCHTIGCAVVSIPPVDAVRLYGTSIVTLSIESLNGVPVYAQQARVRVYVRSWKEGQSDWITYGRPSEGRGRFNVPLGARSLWTSILVSHAAFMNEDEKITSVGYELWPRQEAWETDAPSTSTAEGLLRADGTARDAYVGPLVFGFQYTVQASVNVHFRKEQISFVEFLTTISAAVAGIYSAYLALASLLTWALEKCLGRPVAVPADQYDENRASICGQAAGNTTDDEGDSAKVVDD